MSLALRASGLWLLRYATLQNLQSGNTERGGEPASFVRSLVPRVCSVQTRVSRSFVVRQKGKEEEGKAEISLNLKGTLAGVAPP